MKRFAAIILVFALFLSLAACGTNNSGQQASQDSGAPSSGNAPSNGSAPSSSGVPSAAQQMPAPGKDVTVQTFKTPTGEATRYITAAPIPAVKEDPTTLYVGQTSVPIQSGNPGSGTDSCFYPLVFDKLVEFNYDTGEYIGHVIKDWKIAADGLSMDITMPDSIIFHNGTKATIDDVLYSLWRFSKPDLATMSDKTVFTNIDFDKSAKSGDYAAKLVFKAPSLAMLSGFTNCYLMSKAYIEKVEENNAWWNACIGSGPYKVESIVQGDRYNLVKADSYWGSLKGSFNKIVIRFYAEASTMYVDYETNKLDIMVNPLAVDVKRVIDGAVNNTICDIYPMTFLAYMAFNEEKNPVLADMNVRKAIILAVDPAIVTKMGLDFLGTPTISLMQTGLDGRYERPITRDLEGAKAALEAAGYKPGELKIKIGTSTNNVNSAIAEAVQAQLAEAGIVGEIISADPAVNINNLQNNGPDTYDMAQGFIQYGTLEPNAILMVCSKAAGSNSFAAVSDDRMNELSKKCQTALTKEEKAAALIELQTFLYDNWWYLPLFEQKVALVYKDCIKGIRCIAPRSLEINAVTIAG